MNFVLQIDQIHIDSTIKFLEKKNNNMMDGDFTKIFYSDEYVTLNGFYVNFPIVQTSGIINTKQRPILQNMHIVNKFCDLEKQLIEMYKEYMICDKTPVYLLQQQLHNGFVKVYSNYNSIKPPSKMVTHAIKISGLWESGDSVGITYKIIEMYLRN